MAIKAKRTKYLVKIKIIDIRKHWVSEAIFGKKKLSLL